ncbi:PRMT5 arginine-N-methyltransferase-domain-containing protein [Lipomyces orientalis]|uniref:PRMT5 arginine-N-methyltransferase-domain-containing protein n=1 Tax=Lipomyces orientalis TaxID=1233043 RepID=A0ACC3TNZ3_9ASCO
MSEVSMDHDKPLSPTYYIGLQPEMSSIDTAIDSEGILSSVTDGYDVLSVPITNPRFRSRVSRISQSDLDTVMVPHVAPPTYPEVNFAPNTTYAQHVFGLCAKWIELDSADPRIAGVSTQVLKHELSYASFCGLSYVIVPGPTRRNNVAMYAESLNTALAAVPYINVIVHLAMAESGVEEPSSSDSPAPVDSMSIWDIWNSVRTICDYPSRLSVGLQLAAKLPPQSVVSRWFAEPITVLFVSAKIFLSNPKGYPVLSKAHQYLLFKYLKIKPYTILQDVREATQVRTSSKLPSKQDERAYLIYMRHLHTILPSPTAVEKFGQGYQDYLQNPLQPLTDNLESGTYEVFEKDPVKYAQYEKAILKALSERDSNPNGQPIILAVVGAGRGPLVACSLRASERAKVPIFVYAVEKNPNAYTYLLQRKELQWQSNVEVVFTDMRTWNPAHKVDIMISELLGSFGDNELSPECLDGVQNVLKDNGIMIPQSYSSHFIPAMSPKIFSSIKLQNKEDVMNTPYVVMLQAVDLLAPEIKQAWEFRHPCPYVGASSSWPTAPGIGEAKQQQRYDDLGIDYSTAPVVNNKPIHISNEHNNRHVKARFSIENRGVMHGFVGYFESVLYGDVELSTRPDTINKKSKDMVSWFPIWFPISTPLYVPDSAEIEIAIWRKTDNRKVWYEWSVETFMLVPGSGLDGSDSMATMTTLPARAAGSRVRLGCSRLHNAGGRYSSMLL